METLVNVVFMGKFGYPSGMAATKRIQHFLDYLNGECVGTRVLLLSQRGGAVSRDPAEGTYKGTEYKKLRYDIRLNSYTFHTLLKYFTTGISTLESWRVRGAKNILYCYGGLTLENIVFVLVGKIFGYRVLLDIVEDSTFIEEKLHLAGKVKWLASEVLDRFSFKLADGLVVISSYLKELYAKKPDASVPICLIPISAKCHDYPGKTKERGPLKIVYAGSFAKKDGLELLIEAFEKIDKEAGECVLMLSGTGANVKVYEPRIAANPAIRYLGYLDDAEFDQFLQQADVLCVTRTGSVYANAGFPFKLGEYLATGNPVIVSDVGDVRTYLEDMVDAIIVEPDNVAAITGALEYCIRNPEATARIGRNGEVKCREHFDPLVNGRKLLELIHSL